ncbi:MAG: hypothetical protein ACXWUG_03245 [Polyangiales bacterium]
MQFEVEIGQFQGCNGDMYLGAQEPGAGVFVLSGPSTDAGSGG